jgi:hypothetical protein
VGRKPDYPVEFSPFLPETASGKVPTLSEARARLTARSVRGRRSAGLATGGSRGPAGTRSERQSPPPSLSDRVVRDGRDRHHAAHSTSAAENTPRVLAISAITAPARRKPPWHFARGFSRSAPSSGLARPGRERFGMPAHHATSARRAGRARHNCATRSGAPSRRECRNGVDRGPRGRLIALLMSIMAYQASKRRPSSPSAMPASSTIPDSAERGAGGPD